MGCERNYCNGRNGVVGWFVVCEYSPLGNVDGEYQANVQDAIKGWKSCAQGGDCPSTGNTTGIPTGGAAGLNVSWINLLASMFLFFAVGSVEDWKT